MSSSAWFQNGAGTACTKHLLRLSRRLDDGAGPEIRVLETFLCPHAGLFKVGARSRLDCVQLCDGLGGGAEQSSTSSPRDLDVGPRTLRSRVSRSKKSSLPRLVAGPVGPVGGARRASVQGAVGKTRRAFSIAPAGSTGHGAGVLPVRSQRGGAASWRGAKAERERVSNHSEGCLALLAMDLRGALWRTGMPKHEVLCGFAFAAPVRRRAHPLSSLHRQESFRIERLVAQQHEIDGAPEPCRQNAQCAGA